MDENTYLFQDLGHSEETGFNDPLILNFTDPIYNLTRESIQNIVDAKDPQISGPARVEFELIRKPANSLPNDKKLKNILEACWRHERDDKSEGEEFFKKAFELMNDDKAIDILKISDYNTTGLFGDEEDRSGAYYKLMRIQGSSNKTKGMGGSYGLGKGAYFRPSLFRTIFVSSVTKDGQVVFQGKLRFVSHEMNNVIKHGIGLFSYPAVRTTNEIPEFFRRSDQGTSIFIIGFEEIPKWETQMIEAVLRYFWLAILEGKLEVKIGKIELNQTNVEEIIYKYFSGNKQFDKDNPIPFLKAYKDGIVVKENLNILGNVELRILLDKSFPKRIEYFRNTGMVIQNKSHNSGKGFAGVFICPDENEILRRMEDPTHSKWTKEVPTTSDRNEKKLYSDAELELKTFVDSTLKKRTSFVETTETVIKDLDKYFYSPADDNQSDSNGDPESIEGQLVMVETGSLVRGENSNRIPPKIKKPITIPFVVPGSPDGEGEGGGKGGGEGHGDGKGHVDDEGDIHVKINKNINFQRSYIKYVNSNTYHVIIISGSPGDKFNIDVRVGTEDSYDSFNIHSVEDELHNEYEIERHYTKKNELAKILIKNVLINSEGKLKLYILFAESGKYSLNLRAYENQ